MTRLKRKKLFVDTKIQGALLLRCVLRWLLCVVCIVSMMLIAQYIFNPARPSGFDVMWLQIRPALLAALLLLPIFVADWIYLSNRFVGPLLRLRAGMRRLAAGESVEPLRFRKHDFWAEAAEEFNAVAARIERATSESTEVHAADAVQVTA